LPEFFALNGMIGKGKENLFSMKLSLSGLALLVAVFCLTTTPLPAQNQRAENPAPKAEEPSAPSVDYHLVEQVVSVDQGRMHEILVRPGQQVKKGDQLGSLDYRRQWFHLERAKVQARDQSKIRELEAEVSLNSSVLDEQRERLRRRQVNEHTVKQSEARLQASRAKLDAARTAQALQSLALQEAQMAYDDRFFFSPIDGVVISIHKEKHENVAAGQLVFVIGDHSSWVVRSTVSAEVAASLFVGKTQQLLRQDSTIPRFGLIRGIIPQDDGRFLVETTVPNSTPATQTNPPQFEEPKFSPEPQDSPGGSTRR
jgi:biotin carboxyl carrier protein